MLYDKIFRELEKRKIKYLVIGGIAVNLYGFSRATGDLDIIVLFDKKNLVKFVEMVKFLKYKPKVPVSLDEFVDPIKRQAWIKDKNMKVFSVYNPENLFEHVDIMVQKYIDINRAYKKREILVSDDLKISVISIDDLIKLKKTAGRERDKIDINALLRIKELKNERKKKK